MNEKVSGYIRLYTFLETFAHNCYRKWWAWCYSNGQLKNAKKVYGNWKTLTKAQKKEIAAFWGLKHPKKSDFATHEIMLNVKGVFDVRYVPEKVFRVYLDPMLGNRQMHIPWNDKNYFDRHQPQVPLPYTYVRNVNGYFLDHDYNPISQEKARTIILERLPLIIKPSLDSGEGKNLKIITMEQEADDIFTHFDKDYLLQEVLVQCDELKQMSPRSVNSMRIITALVNGETKQLTGHLLCNTTDAIAVNTAPKAPGTGVVLIKTDNEGVLSDVGYYENAQKLQTLPSGFTFGGLQIPGYKEAVRLALDAHKSMPFTSFIGWDITVDDNNKPVVIEWNLMGIEIYHSQLTNGPLFGEYTDYFAAKAKELMSKR